MANEFHICVIKSEDFDQLLTEHYKLNLTDFIALTPGNPSLELSKRNLNSNSMQLGLR